MRVAGESTVAPIRIAHVQPHVEGTVDAVYVREGDSVTPGTILAQMDDSQSRAHLAGALAKRAEAAGNMARALAANDLTTAGVQKMYADYWQSEVDRARQEVERANIRAAIAGVVTTPHIEDAVGSHLKDSDTFAEVADLSTARVHVAVDESDAALLQPGDHTSIKLLAFPSRTFTGTVTVVSPRAEAAGDRRIVYAEVEVPNVDGILRSGMQGRAKIFTGWHKAGYVFFRRPGMWIAEHLWSLFGS
jgi:RND family efflux transporter MFP subunit